MRLHPKDKARGFVDEDAKYLAAFKQQAARHAGCRSLRLANQANTPRPLAKSGSAAVIMTVFSALLQGSSERARVHAA